MTYPSETLKFRGFLSRLLPVLSIGSRASQRQVLDVRLLSDHLKRDMGFLDGAPTGKRR